MSLMPLPPRARLWLLSAAVLLAGVGEVAAAGGRRAPAPVVAPPPPPAPVPPPATASLPTSSAATNPASSDEASALAPPIIDVPVSPRRAHFYGRVALGFAYRWAFSQSMPGANLIAELGAQDLRWSGGVRLHIEAGQLLTGLPHQVVLIGPQIWMKMHERIRLGVGVDPGMLLISRRTMPGRSMWTVVLGGHVGATADLLRLGSSGALHAELGVGAYGLTQAPGPISVSTHLGLGYRL
ncbi:MAG TPA: hypothetical protein PKI03_06510 [Pseudomonadota bacterium]|nr:hypothetical protein [Pseudomonadota bacterium]